MCDTLHKKYTSILSSDDQTSGLEAEVIQQFTHIKPLFEELEKVITCKCISWLVTPIIHTLALNMIYERSLICWQIAKAGHPDAPAHLQQRLVQFDRELSVIDHFLRIHEALQDIITDIRGTRGLRI